MIRVRWAARSAAGCIHFFIAEIVWTPGAAALKSASATFARGRRPCRASAAAISIAIESIVFLDATVEDLGPNDIVVGTVGNSALFASRFRECAVRALLIPRRRPGQRTLLWQQRQRAAD